MDDVNRPVVVCDESVAGDGGVIAVPIYDTCLRLLEHCARGTLANAPPHGNHLNPSREGILASIDI